MANTALMFALLSLADSERGGAFWHRASITDAAFAGNDYVTSVDCEGNLYCFRLSDGLIERATRLPSNFSANVRITGSSLGPSCIVACPIKTPEIDYSVVLYSVPSFAERLVLSFVEARRVDLIPSARGDIVLVVVVENDDERGEILCIHVESASVLFRKKLRLPGNGHAVYRADDTTGILWDDGSVTLIESASGLVRQIVQCPGGPVELRSGAFMIHDGGVDTYGLSRDGSTRYSWNLQGGTLAQAPLRGKECLSLTTCYYRGRSQVISIGRSSLDPTNIVLNEVVGDQLKAETSSVKGVPFSGASKISPDGTWLVFRAPFELRDPDASFQRLFIWDRRRREWLKPINGPYGKIQALAFSASGAQLAVGGDSYLAMVDLKTMSAATLNAKDVASPRWISFDGEARLLFVDFHDRSMYLGDAITSNQAGQLVRRNSSVEVRGGICHCTDNQVLIAGFGSQPRITLGNWKALSEIGVDRFDVRGSRFANVWSRELASTPSCKVFAAIRKGLDNDSVVEVFSKDQSFTLRPRHGRRFTDLSLSKDGDVIAFLERNDGSVDGESVLQVFKVTESGLTPLFAWAAPGVAITSLVATKDGVVFGDKAGTLGALDRTGVVKERILAHRGTVTSLAFDASRHQLATGGSDGVIRIWSDLRKDGSFVSPK